MEKNYLAIILLLCTCCCKTKTETSDERVGKSGMNYPSDVVVVKDSIPIANDLFSSDKDYLVSKHFIGTLYVSNQDTIIEEFVRGFPPNVMKEIHSYGKEVIPYLISHIDIERHGVAGFFNPYESNLQGMVIDSPMGINYAYMIELIMAKDSIKDNYVFGDGYSSWEKTMEPYNMYGQCVIIRKKDINCPTVSKTTYEDMKIIKAIYSNWWETNKTQNLDSLRKEWSKIGSPLLNSSFMWI